MPGETWTRQAEPALHGEHGGYDCRASATARASPSVDVEMHRGSTPKRRDSPSRNADTVDAFLDSKKTRHGGRQVCNVYIMGSTFPTGAPHEEPDIERSPVTDQQDNDEEESPCVAPELVVEWRDYIFRLRLSRDRTLCLVPVTKRRWLEMMVSLWEGKMECVFRHRRRFGQEGRIRTKDVGSPL